MPSRELAACGFVVLDDRRIPGHRDVIDRIVVGPTGTFVVATPDVTGRLEIRGRELYVDGWNRTGFVDQIRFQALAVRRSIARGAAPPQPIICVRAALLPLWNRTIDEVTLVSSRGLVKAVTTGPAVFHPHEVRTIAARLEAALPPSATPLRPAQTMR